MPVLSCVKFLSSGLHVLRALWGGRSTLGVCFRIAPSDSGQQSLPPAGHSENDSVETGQGAWVGDCTRGGSVTSQVTSCTLTAELRELLLAPGFCFTQKGPSVRFRSVFCPKFQSPFKTVHFITACGPYLAFWHIPAVAGLFRVAFIACSQGILTDSAVGKEAPAGRVWSQEICVRMSLQWVCDSPEARGWRRL